jgi:hypothetical protein
LTNMVLVAILGASVDKSHSTKSSNKSGKHLNDSQPSSIALLHNSQAPLNSIVPTTFEDDPQILVSSLIPLEFQQNPRRLQNVQAADGPPQSTPTVVSVCCSLNGQASPLETFQSQRVSSTNTANSYNPSDCLNLGFQVLPINQNEVSTFHLCCDSRLSPLLEEPVLQLVIKSRSWWVAKPYVLPFGERFDVDQMSMGNSAGSL